MRMLFVFIASVFVSGLHAMDLPPEGTNLVLDEANIEKILDNFIQDIQIKPQWLVLTQRVSDEEIELKQMVLDNELERIKNEIKGALLQNLKRNTLRVNSIEEHLQLLSYCLNNWNFEESEEAANSIKYFLPLSPQDLESMAQLGKFLEATSIRSDMLGPIVSQYLEIRADFRKKSMELFEYGWNFGLAETKQGNDWSKSKTPELYAIFVMMEVNKVCLLYENVDQLPVQEIISWYKNWRSFYNLLPTPVSSAWNYLFPGYRIPQ